MTAALVLGNLTVALLAFGSTWWGLSRLDAALTQVPETVSQAAAVAYVTTVVPVVGVLTYGLINGMGTTPATVPLGVIVATAAAVTVAVVLVCRSRPGVAHTALAAFGITVTWVASVASIPALGGVL